MGLFEKDYLLRLLEQLAAMVAAIRTAIRGGKHRDALAAIAEAQQRLAGPLAMGLDRLDPASILSLLGAEKARVYAELLQLEAEAREGLGETAKVNGIRALATGLERAAGPAPAPRSSG